MGGGAVPKRGARLGYPLILGPLIFPTLGLTLHFSNLPKSLKWMIYSSLS